MFVSLTGRVWARVFPVRDIYMYRSDDGIETVVVVLRKVMEGRRFFGTDFWYSGYYFTGKFSVPDLFKVEVIFS